MSLPRAKFVPYNTDDPSSNAFGQSGVSAGTQIISSMSSSNSHTSARLVDHTHTSRAVDLRGFEEVVDGLDSDGFGIGIRRRQSCAARSAADAPAALPTSDAPAARPMPALRCRPALLLRV